MLIFLTEMADSSMTSMVLSGVL